MELLGGRLWLESREGHGSTFHAAVPVTPVQRHPGGLDYSALSGVRILLVDETAASCAILARQLTYWGMRVTRANSGAAALEQLQSAEAFAVVLLNSNADLAGSHLRGQTPPAIVLTTGMTPEETTRFGAVNYLTKPVRQPELLKALLTIVPSAAAHQVPPAAPPEKTVENLSGPPRRALRIILAEDNRVNQIFAKRLLEKRVYKLTVANNGLEVLNLLSQDSFDLVLMDIQMPEMDGFEAAAAIRAQESGSDRHIPIVAMTAHAMKEDRDKCLGAGMDDYVSKPIDPMALAAAIDRVMNAAATHSDRPR